MVILGGLLLLLAIGILLWVTADYDLSARATAGMALTIFAGLFLFVALVGVPLTRAEVQSQIVEYQALVETIERARDSGRSEIERAALVCQIADMNRYIAKMRYWNTFWNGALVGVYIPDSIMKLEMLH